MLNILANVLLPGRKTFTAELRGVSGFTGTGTATYRTAKNGADQLEIEVRGIAGETAHFHDANGNKHIIALKNGRSRSRFGDIDIQNAVDHRFEIHQNDKVILMGDLKMRSQG